MYQLPPPAMSRCRPCSCASASSTTAPFLLAYIPAASLRSGGGAFSAAVGRSSLQCGGGRPRRGQETVAAGSKDDGSGTAEGNKGEDDAPAFNPFGFVTDNPSSRSAIQLPAVPAEDGNVGQMLYRIEDKGREYGSYVRAGEFRWFVRETGSPDARRGTIVFLHGAPAQSFSYRVVMAQVASLNPYTIGINTIYAMISRWYCASLSNE